MIMTEMALQTIWILIVIMTPSLMTLKRRLIEMVME